MEIFSRDGLGGALRMAHVIVAVMWMGLLWFFNFVQTPAYAEMDASSRNDAFDKLTWRALWWFRWSAAATVAFGLLIIAIAPTGSYNGDFWIHSSAGPTLLVGILIIAVWPDQYNGDYWKSTSGVTLLLGIIMGLVMAANVWMVIWPNQQIVIANARNVQAGGEANPEAAAAGRRGAMASRQNTIFSLPLLVFMVGASHFYNFSHFDVKALTAMSD